MDGNWNEPLEVSSGMGKVTAISHLRIYSAAGRAQARLSHMNWRHRSVTVVSPDETG